jgi:hypothetical protein
MFVAQAEPCGHARTRKDMQVHGRNFGAFRSNLLKSNNSLSHERFSDLNRTELENRLARLAEVRPAVVARGKALVANPDYPDRDTVKRISHLLATKIRA